MTNYYLTCVDMKLPKQGELTIASIKINDNLDAVMAPVSAFASMATPTSPMKARLSYIQKTAKQLYERGYRGIHISATRPAAN